MSLINRLTKLEKFAQEKTQKVIPVLLIIWDEDLPEKTEIIKRFKSKYGVEPKNTTTGPKPLIENKTLSREEELALNKMYDVWLKYITTSNEFKN